MTDDFYGYYRHWSRLNSGMGLPFSGGPMDYPNKFITIMEIFTGELERAKNGN